MKKENNFKNVKNDLDERFHKVVEGATEKVANGVDWMVSNPEKVVAGIGLGIAVMQASRSLVVSHRVRSERKRIDRTYYDPSTGFHWDLRRAATNKDRMEILNRKKAGEDIVQILSDLKLIKM